MNEIAARSRLSRLETRAAPVTVLETESGERTVEVVWTTGGLVQRYSWSRDEEFDEELVVDPSALRLARLNSGAPFLDSHRSYGLGSILGVIVGGSVRIEGGKGYATIRISDREEVEPIWRDMKAGIIRNVSVGYKVHKFERTAMADRKDGGQRALYRAVDWEPMEISAVAISADPGAQTRDEPSIGAGPVIIEKGKHMPDGTTAPSAGAQNTATVPDRIRCLAQSEQIISASMLERRAPVLNALSDLAERHVLNDEDTLRAMNAAVTAPDAEAADQAMRSAVIDALSRRSAGLGPISEPSGFSVGRSWDSPQSHIAKISDARAAQVAKQWGIDYEPTVGRELASLESMDQIAWLAQQRGVRHRNEREVLDWFVRRGAGQHGTSDMPIVAAATAELVVARSIQQSPIGLLGAVSRIPASDWRPRNHHDMSSASPIRDILEHGELQYVTIDENGEVIAPPRRKAAGFAASEEVLRNAVRQGVQLDLRIAKAMNETANEALRATLGAAILNPPALSDGLGVFHADRGTVGAGGDIDVSGVSEARAKMARFKDSQGTTRPVPLSKILCAPEQLTDAEKLVAEIHATEVENANPFQKRIEILTDPEIPDGVWFALPDPAAYDGLALVLMDDMPFPRIESRESWNTFGVEWRLQWPMSASWLKPVWWRNTAS